MGDWGTFDLGNHGLGGQAAQPSSRPDPRLSRDRLFTDVASLYGQRSSCPRGNVGVVAVREGRVIAAGYAGAPSGLPHCFEAGCIMEAGHCVRSVHAEANMIAWAARVGTPLAGSDVYCTHEACYTCAKLLVNAGIRTFQWQYDYSDHRGSKLLIETGIVELD